MSAVREAVGAGDVQRRLQPMTTADLDAVMAIENGAYGFPWTRGNFIDSLSAGYIARLLRCDVDPALVGYFVAMEGAEEMHLLNITVAAPHRRRGHAAFMIGELLARCRRDGAARLWLEVRESNAGARLGYSRLGFTERGLRPGYYPAPGGAREAAVVMSRAVEPVDGASDALE